MGAGTSTEHQISFAVWNQSIEKVNNSIKPVSGNAWENFPTATVLLYSQLALCGTFIKINHTEKRTPSAHKKKWRVLRGIRSMKSNGAGSIKCYYILWLALYISYTWSKSVRAGSGVQKHIVSSRFRSGGQSRVAISKGSSLARRLIGPVCGRSVVTVSSAVPSCQFDPLQLMVAAVAASASGIYIRPENRRRHKVVNPHHKGILRRDEDDDDDALKDHVDVFESIGFRQLNCMNSINTRDWLSELDALPLFGHYSAIAMRRRCAELSAVRPVRVQRWTRFLGFFPFD